MYAKTVDRYLHRPQSLHHSRELGLDRSLPYLAQCLTDTKRSWNFHGRWCGISFPPYSTSGLVKFITEKLCYIGTRNQSVQVISFINKQDKDQCICSRTAAANVSSIMLRPPTLYRMSRSSLSSSQVAHRIPKKRHSKSSIYFFSSRYSRVNS